MNKTPRVALLVTGPVRPDLLVNLPALARRIGPVMAGSLQHASRVVNALRHGEPARSLEPLRTAKTILCAGSPAGEMVATLGKIPRSWRGTLVIFAGSPGPDPAPELVRLGADVATAALLSTSGGKPLCVVSGSAEAAKLLRSCGAKVVRTAAGRALACHGASAVLETLLPQLLEAASAHWRQAGFSTSDTRSLVSEQVSQLTRAYLRTRKRPSPSSELEALAARVASGDAVP